MLLLLDLKDDLGGGKTAKVGAFHESDKLEVEADCGCEPIVDAGAVGAAETGDGGKIANVGEVTGG